MAGWVAKTGLTGTIRYSAGGVIGSTFYVAGGGGSLPSTDTWAYSPLTNAWTSAAAMPDARWFHAVGVMGTKLYASGGDDGSTSGTTSLFVYDQATDTWATKAPASSVGLLQRHGAATIGTKLYVAGGYTTSKVPADLFAVYDQATDTWATKAPMPIALSGLGIAAIGSKLYVVGGVNSAGNSTTSLFVYDQATDTWATKAPMPATRWQSGVTADGDRLYVVGGRGDSGGDQATLFIYDRISDTWSTGPSLPEAIPHPTVAVSTGKLYAFGPMAIGKPSHLFELVLNTPPNAPILTSMTGAVFVDKNVVNRASHQFSDPDPGDSQSSFFFRYRLVGASSWTTLPEQQTPNQYYSFAPNTLALGDYERQVATRDAIGIPTQTVDLVWSPSGFFTVGTTPIGPTFTDPTNNQSIFLNAYTATISVPDATKTEWRTVADNAGAPDPNVIYSPSVVKTTGNLRTFTFSFPVNNRTEHLQARAFFEGLWSPWADSTNPISFTEPQAPVVTTTPDPENGRLLIAFTNPAPSGGQPSVAYNDVWIDDRDGLGWVRKATLLPTNSLWPYYTPRSGITTGVKVTAVAVNGTTAETTTSTTGVLGPDDIDGGTPATTGDGYLDGGTI